MNYISFDTETGNLDPKKGDVLTAYFVVMDENFKILDELDLKLKPDGGRLPLASAEALNINKIDIKQHLQDPETVTYTDAKEKLVKMLKRFCTGKNSRLRPIGQNIDFDIKFVQEYLLPFEEYDKLLHYGKLDTKMITDFMKDAGWLPPDLGNLGSLCKHFDVNLGDKAHNAKHDTLATVEVYKKLLGLMASKKDSGSQSVDLIDLLEQE
jgi:DNA polymerase III epsilon subunit-like protein